MRKLLVSLSMAVFAAVSFSAFDYTTLQAMEAIKHLKQLGESLSAE